MNKRHYEHTLPNIRGSLSNTYILFIKVICMNCFIGVEENGILSGGKWLCQILLSIQGFKVLYFI